MPEGKIKKYHLNVQLTTFEHQHLEKFCVGYGTKNKLIRALIRRFLTEQGVITPIVKVGVDDEV